MSKATAATAPPPARDWAGDLRRSLPLAALVATANSSYTVGWWLVTDSGVESPLRSLLQAWTGQFSMCMLILTWVTVQAPRLAPSGWVRRGGLLALTLQCSVIGTLVNSVPLLLSRGPEVALENLRFFALWVISLSAVLVLAETTRRASRQAQQALDEAELASLALTRELDTARMQLLQAQVEPHFLFNALANVRRLLRTEPEAGRSLLGELLRYLQEALPALRGDSSTLAQEAELVRAFLAVHQVRMGARLQAEVDVPAELGGTPLPPMVLLTLVENALKHGLQPLVDGGSVRVHARARDGQLVVSVADTGRGMGSGSGGGTGLANVRARLRQLHGSAASLSLAMNEPRGVVATISVPLAPAETAR